MTQKQPLTDSQIRKLKPQKTPYRDSQSLFLKVTETSKIWLFSYIHPITQKRITKKHIGYYPAISLQEARRLRDEYRNSVQKGFCPFELAEKEAKERREKAITVEKIAIKWLEWKSEKKKLKEQTRKATKSRLERYLFPLMGKTLLSDVKMADAVQAFEKMKNRSDILDRVLGNFIEIMDYARFLGLIQYNPIEGIKKAFEFKAPTNQPTIPPDDLPEFLAALNRANRQRQTKLLVKWQLVTMLRSFEACSVKWSDVDFEQNILTIPAERMKGGQRAHRVPLSSQALEILEEMRGFNGHRDHIFAGYHDHLKPMNSQTVNGAITRLENGRFKGKLTAHGLRSIASTYLNDKFTTEPHIIEACLAHIDSNQVRNAYNRGDYLDRRRVLMQAWGDFVSRCEQP